MKLQEILDYLNISQNCDIEISGLNGLKDATSNELSFLESSKYISSLKDTKAAAVFVNKEFEQDVPSGTIAIVCDEPYINLAKASKLFAPKLIASNTLLASSASPAWIVKGIFFSLAILNNSS